MYDVQLAYMVVAHSQRDPGEYLMELQQLVQAPTEGLRRHAMDMHLGRFQRALQHLVAAGQEHFPKALQLARAKASALLSLFAPALQQYPMHCFYCRTHSASHILHHTDCSALQPTCCITLAASHSLHHSHCIILTAYTHCITVPAYDMTQHCNALQHSAVGSGHKGSLCGCSLSRTVSSSLLGPLARLMKLCIFS